MPIYFKRVFSYVHYTPKHFETVHLTFSKRLDVYFTCRFQNGLMHLFQNALMHRFKTP